eukprot:gene23491-44018_t
MPATKAEDKEAASPLSVASCATSPRRVRAICLGRRRKEQLMSPDVLGDTIFIEANGQRFETLIAGKGGRKLAMLLHGFPESNYSWRFQIPLLVKLGYEVWAPNLRGYGRSSKPAHLRDYSIEYLMED